MVPKIAMLYSRIRLEEKMLIEEALRRGIDLIRIDSRHLIMTLDKHYEFDVLLERDVSHSRALYALNLFQGSGVKTINSYRTAAICGDKVATTNALVNAGIPTPDVKIAFTREAALHAMEEMGYPVILKPVVGSWGRLLSKINDREAAEAILEHKEYLGSYYHSIYYIQEYVKKPGRDIRAFFVDDETICAIYRISQHWITNTARGARSQHCPVTPEINDLCLRAAKAVGGGILAVDLMEGPDGIVVNEVNYTIEFRNSVEPTHVNIPAKIIDYAIKVGKD